MTTRLLYLAFLWFMFSLIVALIGGRRLRVSHPVISLGWLIGILLLGDAWALLIFGLQPDIALLTILAFLLGLLCIRWMRDWNAFGQVAWTTSILALSLFLIYAFQVTAFTPLNPISFVIALGWFFIETIALLIALSHTYESLNSICRIHWRRRLEQLESIPGYQPMVSLHVPVYNEPPEVVADTLRSLAALDYPDYEVLVVDNNTPDESRWRAAQQISGELGPRFHFLHLENWPGYKSGALNFALAQTDPQAEIIGPIDADYQLDPAFLRDLTPAFHNRRLAFIQTPQDYRDFDGNLYLESTYYAYKYFFEVSMPVRNEFDAIIFAGTMGLIRKSALQEIGGWDEWCITEDAEASLRLLKRGYSSGYINRPYGSGLIPFSFEGLKRQRFRWCFGGIQILKKHWSSLLPWSAWVDPNNHLSQEQRYFYLAGGVQWFTDLLNLVFAFLLVLGGLFSLSGGLVTPYLLNGTLIVLPVLFLVLGLLRFTTVLRQSLHLTWSMAIRSMYNFFSLGWVVTLACLQGLIQKEGVFLRTSKSRSESKTLQALTVTRWETLIGMVCLLVGALAYGANPELRTLFLFLLMVWESSLYLSAPYYSLLSSFDQPERRPGGERGRLLRENRAAQATLLVLGLLIACGILIQFLPPPDKIPDYIRFLPAEIPLRSLFLPP
jgi:cellulose synthase/poly-beta-1,6-N-acetylglucosamine synthase-like glycosyltransferase